MTAATDGDRPARRPDAHGTVVRDGVRLAWSRYGLTGSHVVLLPTWSIVHSRIWKAQVATLARHHRVTTFDGRGCGASDRPVGAAAYTDAQYEADVVAVMDATEVDSAVLVGLSMGGPWAVRVAAHAPERVRGVVAIAPACNFPVSNPEREQHPWDQPNDSTEGWAKYNRHRWLSGEDAYDDFLRFFFARMFHETHSTKQIEDGVEWGHQTEPTTLVDTTAARLGLDGADTEPLEPLCRQVRCPVLVMHGTEDGIRPAAVGRRLAELTGAELLLVDGGGHGLPSRHPVLVNRAILRFARQVDPGPHVPRTRTWTRSLRRERRVLYLSSPIGLGHVRRDLAIADELRRLHPDLRVDWLAQDPVDRVLRERGEHVHPASARLLGECGHVDAECGEHDLNAFRTIRRMDEILIANFMVFDELTSDEHYDLVVGDEAWEVDHFLHENPELKRSAYAWFTDFVGWLPMPAGGAREAALTADHNLEMIEQRARFRGLRDRSIFVGDPDDVVDESFGPRLPRIRDWTRENFEFAGYVGGGTPVEEETRHRLRSRLGYRPDERVVLVTVGGSGVGLPLLRRVADAVPLLRRAAPDLRVELVTGPRIDPCAIPARPGLTVHGYLPDVPERLAACDVAVVQGGLTTCMELAAAGRPFVYVPLRNHFEQNIHVRHRLQRYRAGTCLDYLLAADPDALADAVLAELDRTVDTLPVEAGGAARAAGLLADLL